MTDRTKDDPKATVNGAIKLARLPPTPCCGPRRSVASSAGLAVDRAMPRFAAPRHRASRRPAARRGKAPAPGRRRAPPRAGTARASRASAPKQAEKQAEKARRGPEAPKAGRSAGRAQARAGPRAPRERKGGRPRRPRRSASRPRRSAPPSSRTRSPSGHRLDTSMRSVKADALEERERALTETDEAQRLKDAAARPSRSARSDRGPPALARGRLVTATRCHGRELRPWPPPSIRSFSERWSAYADQAAPRTSPSIRSPQRRANSICSRRPIKRKPNRRAGHQLARVAKRREYETAHDPTGAISRPGSPSDRIPDALLASRKLSPRRARAVRRRRAAHRIPGSHERPPEHGSPDSGPRAACRGPRGACRRRRLDPRGIRELIGGDELCDEFEGPLIDRIARRLARQLLAIVIYVPRVARNGRQIVGEQLGFRSASEATLARRPSGSVRRIETRFEGRSPRPSRRQRSGCPCRPCVYGSRFRPPCVHPRGGRPARESRSTCALTSLLIRKRSYRRSVNQSLLRAQLSISNTTSSSSSRARNSIWPASRWPSRVTNLNMSRSRVATRTGPSHGPAILTTYASPTLIAPDVPSSF